MWNKNPNKSVKCDVNEKIIIPKYSLVNGGHFDNNFNWLIYGEVIKIDTLTSVTPKKIPTIVLS